MESDSEDQTYANSTQPSIVTIHTHFWKITPLHPNIFFPLQTIYFLYSILLNWSVYYIRKLFSEKNQRKIAPAFQEVSPSTEPAPLHPIPPFSFLVSKVQFAANF